MQKMITVLLFVAYAQMSLYGNSKDYNNSLHLYSVQGADVDLDHIAPNFINDRLIMEDAYLNALSYMRVLTGKGSRFKMGFETVIGEHSGLQDHIEIAIAWVFKYTDIFPDNFWVNSDVAIGNGFSYAFGVPTYEDTTAKEPNRYYQFQNFLLVDVDFYLKERENIHFTLR